VLDIKKLTGPKAGSLKYDLLTALSVIGLAGSQTYQTSMTRLLALVTARYNWRLDEVTVGQRDLAKMWSVNERTVKREMKRLTDCAILVRTRAGVRGRVAAYRLNYVQIWEQSEPLWSNVGPDFVERMGIYAPHDKVKVVKVNFGETALTAENVHELAIHEPINTWRSVQRGLAASHPDLTKVWFNKLVFQDYEGGCVTVVAPNAFTARYIETHLNKILFDTIKQVYTQARSVAILIA